MSWLDTLLKLYEVYQGGKGKYKQVPDSPEEKAYRSWMIGQVQNNPTRNMFGELIKQRLGNAGTNPLPQYSGLQNMRPTQGVPQQPQTSQSPYDLSKILPNLYQRSGGPKAGAPQAPPQPLLGGTTGKRNPYEGDIRQEVKDMHSMAGDRRHYNYGGAEPAFGLVHREPTRSKYYSGTEYGQWNSPTTGQPQMSYMSPDELWRAAKKVAPWLISPETQAAKLVMGWLQRGRDSGGSGGSGGSGFIGLGSSGQLKP